MIGGEKEDVVAEAVEGTNLQAYTNDNVEDPTCFDNYQSWPRSTTKNTSAHWNMNKFPAIGASTSRPKTYEQFLDVNGDGLVDHLFSEWRYHNYGGTHVIDTQEKTCVTLNTGTGWETEYKCLSIKESDGAGGYEKAYYGDCAQL